MPGPVGWTAAIAGFSAIYMALVMPLGRGTDEAQHAFRAYQLATGGLLPQLIACVAHPNVLPCKIHYPGPDVPGKNNTVSACAIDPKTGHLAFLNKVSSRGEGPDGGAFSHTVRERLGSGAEGRRSSFWRSLYPERGV